MNKIILLFSLILFYGCQPKNQDQQIISSPNELCVNGVVYYSFGHGKAPAMAKDGSVITCSEIEARIK